MRKPEQLEFPFMRGEYRRVTWPLGPMLARIMERAGSSMDFEEYEWHRLRYDRLAA